MSGAPRARDFRHGRINQKNCVERPERNCQSSTINSAATGSPGVAAHTVKKISGFKVCYGPIRAKDLTAYLDSGMKVTPDMRIMTFPLKTERCLFPSSSSPR